MTALFVLLMFVGFVLIDILVRLASRRIRAAGERKKREAVLHTSLQLDFAHEAKSLKRVEVPNARGRILAVDDEPVILDSFRKILVLAGFSVDTVENGPEALGLVQRNDYDLVFTDLKMPEMDGVEVVKAVRHLRPDVDMAVITGYGTIETAVETMKHGATDYVQKPFTEEELSDFANKLMIRREARLEAQRQPTVRLAAPSMAEKAAHHEYCIPGGAFFSEGHTWARIEASGQVRVGLDDFARKALGGIEGVELPPLNETVRGGQHLFTVKGRAGRVRLISPLSGRVMRANEALRNEPSRMAQSPYDRGWVCLLQPKDLAADIVHLKIGKPVVDWYQTQIARLRESKYGAPGTGVELDWAEFEKEFLTPKVAAGV